MVGRNFGPWSKEEVDGQAGEEDQRHLSKPWSGSVYSKARAATIEK